MFLHSIILPFVGLLFFPTNQPMRTPASQVTSRALTQDAHEYLEYASGQTIDEMISKGQNYDPQSGTITVSRKLYGEMLPGRDFKPDMLIRLEDLALNADAVIIGTPLDVTSELTQTRKFVFSEYQVRVTKVILNHDLNLLPTQTIVVTRPGGEVSVDGHAFRAIDPDVPKLVIGQSYVFFLHFKADSQTFKAGPEETYLVAGEQVQSTQLHSDVIPFSVKRTTFLETLDKAVTLIAGQK